MSDSTTREVPTGLALEKARRRVGFSAPDAAARLGINPGLLGEFENGIRTPDQELIAVMSQLYGVEPGRLASRPLVPRVPSRYDSDAGVLWMGWSSIQIREKDNEQIIRSIAAALRSMRSLADFSPVLLRSTELPLLSSLFDLHDLELEDLLMRYLNVPPSDALGIVNEMIVYASVS